MNKEFIHSISSAVASKEAFFTVNFGPKQIKIFFTEEACDWVWNYKYLQRPQALQIKSQLNSPLKINRIALINYFYNFIMTDISILNSYISPTIKSVLDIGAGIGLFDLFLNQILDHEALFDLVEVDKLEEIEHVTNNPEHTKKLDHNVQIKPVAVLKKLMITNNAHNINIIDSKSINQHLQKRYDLILSFRSWGYLYDLDLYQRFVRKTLKPDGIVITDLSIYDDSIEKFSSLFNDVVLIDEAPNNKRFLGKNLK
jgi:SAM-dependent methyltransferase